MYGLAFGGMILLGVIGVFLFYILILRRIVPTNEVHIVQRGKSTTSYGVGKESNVYYELPAWLPIWGVAVRKLPVSNFDIALSGYEAYDQDKVPFETDVVSFFHISDSTVASSKVEDFGQLKLQLKTIVQGAIRSILANAPIETIMEERATFGKQFTDAVKEDLANWGVSTTKNIELMDVRDAHGSQVIEQIQAKRMSAIESDSRKEVAKNNQEAEQAELESKKEVSVKEATAQREAGEAKAESDQAIGIANATANQKAGVANQEAESAIAKSAADTEENRMAVIRITQIRQKEIDRAAAIIQADLERKQLEINADANKYNIETQAKADKFNIETRAEAALKEANLTAEGIRSIGRSEASVVEANGLAVAVSTREQGLARVAAEITLSQKIGENKEYQDYLIRIEEVKVTQIVGVAEAEAKGIALASADLKVLVNSGDVQTGLNGFQDILSSKGGSQMNGVLEALEQTPMGGKLMSFLNSIPDVVKTKAKEKVTKAVK